MACANVKGERSLAGTPLNEPGQLSPPIWPCTTRGFPCPRNCYRGGGLLPHLFTLTNSASIARRLAGFACEMPPCCASAGGLFSVALSVASPCSEAPWRYQARCPVKSSGQQIVGHASGRCPDFPPATAPCGPSSQRLPGPPAALSIPCKSTSAAHVQYPDACC